MLAAGASRKCHGSRNLLHKLRTGCVMHDASYHAVLQISATQEAMFQLLSRMWLVFDYLPYLGKDDSLFLPRFSSDLPSLTTDCETVTMQCQNPVRQASPQHQVAHKFCKNHPRKEKKPLLTVQSELSLKSSAAITVLLLCSDPSKLAHAQLDKKFLGGHKEFRLVLHHGGEYPAGAIAPASLLFDTQSLAAGG